MNWHEIRSELYYRSGIKLENESLYDFLSAVRAHHMSINEFTGQLRKSYKETIEGITTADSEITDPKQWTQTEVPFEDFQKVSHSMLDDLAAMDAMLAPTPVVE